MRKCKSCQEWGKKYHKDVTCGLCPDGPYENRGFNFSTPEVVVLNGSYKTTKSRVNELERRVVLNYDKKTGSYDVGRRGENGKIQERQPNYYK
jgi:hypothetical protein